MKDGCYRRNNRPFRIIYVTITSMIAGLPLRLASRRALQRILELFRVRHLLAVTADGFDDLHARP
jgi:hypothetical protein